MSLIGTCSDCGTGGVSLRYKPEVPINEQSRPSICDRCRDFREEQATHYVPCEECGDRLPSERAHSLDVTAEDEYYPKFIHFCPACAPDETDDEPELATDGGTELGVPCDVDDCDSRIVGLDDGWEFSRGTVCQDCIDYQSRHGHWPDESVDICAECRIDDGMIPHECEESSADRVLIEPGTTCDYCGFEAAVTDGGQPAEDGQAVKHDDPTKRVLIPHESGTGTCYHAIGGCGGHLVTSTTATAEELVTGLGLRPCQSAACLNANIPEYDRCDGCAKPVFGAEPHADGVGRYCPACRAFLDEHPSPSHDQYELRRPSKLVPDGGEEVGRATNHCVDLFAGLGGFSAAFEDSEDWTVTTVDFNPEFDPDLCVDILELQPSDLSDADVVLASPDCKDFSVACITDKWHYDEESRPKHLPEKPGIAHSVKLVFRALWLVQELDPEWWFMENPKGMLQKFIGEPQGTVHYCQYGSDFMKPTQLWGRHPPSMTYRQCARRSDCHVSNAREVNTFRDASRTRAVDSSNSAERAKVPYELSEAILEAVENPDSRYESEVRQRPPTHQPGLREVLQQ